jgi:hypothetical protein
VVTSLRFKVFEQNWLIDARLADVLAASEKQPASPARLRLDPRARKVASEFNQSTVFSASSMSKRSQSRCSGGDVKADKNDDPDAVERGIVVAQGRRKLLDALDELSSESLRCRSTVRARQWRGLDQRIAALEDEFAAMARSDARSRRLATIRIGVLNATALVAAISDATTFSRGRDLAAWLGLVPPQATTGGKPRLRIRLVLAA